MTAIDSKLTTAINGTFTGNTTDIKAGSTTAGVKTANKTLDQMDQASFLTLFTAQMQNQDPFAPMDNSQMAAQMAQFSSVSGIAQMSSTLKTIASDLAASRLGAASSWIGRSMLVESNVATPDRTGAYAGEIALTNDSSAVSVDFIDGDGNVVKSLDLGSQAKGVASFAWDGKDAEGNIVGTGALKVRVNGAGTSPAVATWTSVAAVQSPGDSTEAKLLTPLGAYSPSDAIRIA